MIQTRTKVSHNNINHVCNLTFLYIEESESCFCFDFNAGNMQDEVLSTIWRGVYVELTRYRLYTVDDVLESENQSHEQESC